eukprot:2395948-Amphidinium_carterae.1
MFGSAVEDVSQQEAITGQGEVVTYYADPMDEAMSDNTGGEFIPDAVTGPNLSPPPVTPYSPSETTAPFTFSDQQEATVMSNEYLAQCRERYRARSADSSVSPVTLGVDTANVTAAPQAVDVPVSDDDDMDNVPNEGESQEFQDGEDEPEDEPDQLFDEGAEEEEAPMFEWYLERGDRVEDEDVTDNEVGQTRSRDYRVDRARYQRRRINDYEAGDEWWDFRSGSASLSGRDPWSQAGTNDRHVVYTRWNYKELQGKRQAEDAFAEKLKRHHQHPLWRKCYICEL